MEDERPKTKTHVYLEQIAGPLFGSFGFITFLVGLFVWIFLPEGWIVNPLWYGLKYRGTDFYQVEVHTNTKPSDCDWMYAPLGNKGCHYDRVVTVYNAAGDLIAADAAMPKRSHDKDGKPIISYDGGKTWKWLGTCYNNQKGRR